VTHFKLAAGAFLLLAAMLLPTLARASDKDKNAIAALIEKERKAFEDHDVNSILASYSPGDQLLVFDVVPPLEYRGWDNYKKDWEGILAIFSGPIHNTVTDVSIDVDHSLAYSQYIEDTQLTAKDGTVAELTVRVTDVYRKIRGKWLILHEHISVPVDLATGKADLASKP
jgi:ketosteroid isomerase-like protein